MKQPDITCEGLVRMPPENAEELDSSTTTTEEGDME